MTPGEFCIAHLAAHGAVEREKLAAAMQPYCHGGTSAYSVIQGLVREGIVHATGNGTIALGRHPNHQRPRHMWGIGL